MTPDIRARIRKVAALMSSPNKGEAEAARRIHARLTSQYGSPGETGASRPYTADERRRFADVVADGQSLIRHEQAKESDWLARQWLRDNGYRLDVTGELRHYWQQSTLRYTVRCTHSGAIVAANIAWTELPAVVTRLQLAQEATF